MTPITVLAGKKVLVFGLGGSGLSTARALRDGGAQVLAADDGAKGIAAAKAEGFAIGEVTPQTLAGVSLLVLSPGVPLTHPQPHRVVNLAAEASVPVIGDIELFVLQRRADAPGSPLIGITGTNGKSTTTALITHLFAHAGRDVAMGGNIGVPVLDLPPPAPGRVHVLELSSYQIDLAPSIDASVGILLNVTEDHLDRHGTIQHYADVKERLIAGIAPGGTAIVGVDDELSEDIAERAAGSGTRTVRISVTRELSDGIFARSSQLILAGQGGQREIADLAGIGSLRGAHNAQNAAAAIAAGLALGLSEAEIVAGLKSFPGLKHRLEQVARRGEVLFVNDSKATNADAAARGLGSFDDIYWIAGGKPKTGGISSLAPFFPRIRKAYLIGEAAQDFAATLGAVPHVIAGTMDRAVELAAADAASDSAALAAAGESVGEPVVLLSPACASFDQYPNFEVRGDHFRQLVLALP